MIKKFLQAVFVGTLTFASVATVPVSADVFGGIDCSKAPNSAVCQDKTANDPLTGNNGVIIKIANIVAAITGIAAVVILIVSALKLVTGGGDANEVASARRAIIYALVGILVIAVARLLISLIVGIL